MRSLLISQTGGHNCQLVADGSKGCDGAAQRKPNRWSVMTSGIGNSPKRRGRIGVSLISIFRWTQPPVTIHTNKERKGWKGGRGAGAYLELRWLLWWGIEASTMKGFHEKSLVILADCSRCLMGGREKSSPLYIGWRGGVWLLPDGDFRLRSGVALERRRLPNRVFFSNFFLYCFESVRRVGYNILPS